MKEAYYLLDFDFIRFNINSDVVFSYFSFVAEDKALLRVLVLAEMVGSSEVRLDISSISNWLFGSLTNGFRLYSEGFFDSMRSD